MTVQQLRDWLAKQDPTGAVAARVTGEGTWFGSFELSVHSEMKSSQFAEVPRGTDTKTE